MMVPVISAKPTIAFIYGDEQLVRRNRIREKITARGFVIKKEYRAPSKAFDFTSVDLVVAVREGTKYASSAIDNAAARDVKNVVYIDHALSRAGWERLDGYANPGLTLIEPLPPSTSTPDLDEDTAQLFALIEAERDEAREQIQKLTGELGNVRADREKLSRERDDLRGKVTKLECMLEEEKLDSGEVQDQRAAWQGTLDAMKAKLDKLEIERDAAINANKRLQHELKAAREMSERVDDASTKISKLERDVDRLTKERQEYQQKYSMSAARETRAHKANEELRKKLEEHQSPAKVKGLIEDLAKHANQVVALQQEVAALRKQLDIAKRPLPSTTPAVAKDLTATSDALKNCVKLGLMTSDEAFAKLVEAAK